MLSDYQHAILAEMGITVFKTHDSSKPAESINPVGSPQPNKSSTNATTKISALRQSLGSNKPSERVSKFDSKSKLVADIAHYYSYLGIASPAIENWVVEADKPAVFSADRVSLTTDPNTMTAAQKRALWQAMSTLNAS